MINIVFFGSPEFSVPSLERLVDDDRITVQAVVTQPDRPAGRKKQLKAPPVKQFAVDHKLCVLQPESLKDKSFQQELADLEPDVGVLVAYGEFLPGRILNLPKHRCLNLHPSLLPKYRGASPIQTAILNGDRQTGVTVMEMSRALDGGPVVAQRTVELRDNETASTLHDRLAEVGGELLISVIPEWVAGLIDPEPQDETHATYTYELSKASGRIDWSQDAQSVERHIRAMTPWPSAWSTFRGDRMIVHSASLSSASHVPTAMISAEPTGEVVVGCGSGALILGEIQMAGKGRIPAQDWVRGAHLNEDARLT